MAGLINSCYFTATLGGTTDWTPSAAVTGYMTPSAAGAVNGKVYKYRAESASLTEWELGEGVWNGTTLARTTVFQNSAGTTAKINFTGAPKVGIVSAKQDVLMIDEANSFTAAQKSQARANIDVLKKSYIINGAMMVSQENGTTAGTTTGYYPVDQFAVGFSNGGAISTAQVASTTPAGSPNRLRVTVATADAAVAAGDNAYIFQRIEGLRAADLAFGAASARAITIKFGVKAPAGTYCVVVINSATNRSYVAEYTITGGEANTDVVKSVTIPGDTSGTWLKDTGIGLEIRWGLMAGSTFQQAAGSWSTGNAIGSANQFNFMGTFSNVFELFDVGVYEGTAAPSFQVPELVTEFLLCARYYFVETLNVPRWVAGFTNGWVLPLPKPVPMRIAPTGSHPFTDASFTSSGVVGSTQWGLQIPNFAAATKTGTALFGLYLGAEVAVDSLQCYNATFSITTSHIVPGSSLGRITRTARL